jgi:hypothetical protein
MSTERKIRYAEGRIITQKSTIVNLTDDLWDLHFSDNDLQVLSNHTETTTELIDGTEQEVVEADVRIQMHTTLANEASDRDTFAQKLVDLNLQPDISTAKEKIYVRK